MEGNVDMTPTIMIMTRTTAITLIGMKTIKQ